MKNDSLYSYDVAMLADTPNREPAHPSDLVSHGFEGLLEREKRASFLCRVSKVELSWKTRDKVLRILIWQTCFFRRIALSIDLPSLELKRLAVRQGGINLRTRP